MVIAAPAKPPPDPLLLATSETVARGKQRQYACDDRTSNAMQTDAGAPRGNPKMDLFGEKKAGKTALSIHLGGDSKEQC